MSDHPQLDVLDDAEGIFLEEPRGFYLAPALIDVQLEMS
jgi:hypothetical protein